MTNSINKGKAFERLIARKFRPLYPGAKRVFENREGQGYDIEDCGPFLIQAKRYKSSVPMNKLYEVPDREGTIPLLVSKVDREPELVTLRLDDFLEILKDFGSAFTKEDDS